MKKALAFAAVLALAAGAAAFDQPVIATPTCTHNNFRILEAVLPSILARSLRDSRNSEGLEAARYLDDHLGVAFRIAVDPSQSDAFGGRTSLGPTTMMAYSDAEQEIHIHHALLHLDGGDEDLIIREPARLEKTAVRFWPEIVHETSHARTHVGGGRFIGDAVIEDEFIAFYRQLFFVLEQMETDKGYLGIAKQAPCGRDHASLLARYHAFEPRLRALAGLQRPNAADKRERAALTKRADVLVSDEKSVEARCPGFNAPEGDMALLLAMFARSDDDVESEIRSTYEEKHRLSLDDPDLIPHARAETEKSLGQFEAFLQRDLTHKVPETDPGYATLSALTETTSRIVDSERKGLAFWSDPKTAVPAVAAYKSLMAHIRAEGDAKRARYALVLKPFAPAVAP
jgi:hypothetical protein